MHKLAYADIPTLGQSLISQNLNHGGDQYPIPTSDSLPGLPAVIEFLLLKGPAALAGEGRCQSLLAFGQRAGTFRRQRHFQ